jgi:hypothetical protein
MKRNMASYQARCRCGKQSISMQGQPLAQLVCHCVDCRQVSGERFTEIAFYAPDSCTVSGDFTEATMPGGSSYPKSYYSCPECGSCLYAMVSVLKGQVGVVAGQIEAPFEFAPKFHVWTSEKADGVEIDAQALQFTHGPPRPPHLV